MTNWENPEFNEKKTSASNVVATLDERSVLDVVRDITKARNAAKREILRQKQIAAVAEIHDTIDTLVDWLAELDYPGAEIVAGMERVESDVNQTKHYKVEIPLWLFDVEGSSDTYGYGFGPDKKLYQQKDKAIDNRDYPGWDTCRVYVPIERPDENWIFEVRDGLNNFPIPTEDSLLQ